MANELRSLIIRVSGAGEQGRRLKIGRTFCNLLLRIAALVLAVLHHLITETTAERLCNDVQGRRAVFARIVLRAVTCGQGLEPLPIRQSRLV